MMLEQSDTSACIKYSLLLAFFVANFSGVLAACGGRREEILFKPFDFLLHFLLKKLHKYNFLFSN